MSADNPAPEAASAFLDVVVTPHRSLTPRGFVLLMAVLGGASFTAGIVFTAMGAWPVLGFFGVDVLLVYIALRLNYRSARQHERLHLDVQRFTVERVSVRGERRVWRFEPFWLRVVLDERSEDENRLLLASHGRSLAVGGFLDPAERRTLAAAIADALARWRRQLAPAAQSPSTSFMP